MKRLALGFSAVVIAVIVGVMVFISCSSGSQKVQIAEEMTYTDFLSDGSSSTGQARKYEFVKMGDRIVKVPTILLPLKKGCEIVVMGDDGNIRTFFW